MIEKHYLEIECQKEAFLDLIDRLRGAGWRVRPLDSEDGVTDIWRQALESSGHGLWSWNIARDELFLSRGWKAILGYEADEIEASYQAWESCIHPDDKEDAVASLLQHINGQRGDYQHTHRLRKKDGSYAWILDRGKVIQRDAYGRAQMMVGTHVDISEQKAVEEQLSFHSMILNNIRDRITVVDPGGCITYVNEAVCRLFNTSAMELIGKPVGIYETIFVTSISPDDIIRETREKGEWQGVVVEKLSDGHEQIIKTRAWAIRDKGGQVVALCGINTDITEQEYLKRELEGSRKRLERAQKISRVGHWEIDMNTGLIYNSAMAQQIYLRPGFTAVPVSEAKMLVHPDDRDRTNDALRELLQNGGSYDMEFRLRRDDGSDCYLHSVAEYDRVRNRIFGTLQDITTRRLAEERIQQLLSEKDLLLRETHHRIKNNMSAINSLISLQAQDLDDSKARDLLDELQSRITGMQLIYDQLYRSSEYDSGDLKQYLHELIEKIRDSVLFSEGVELRSELDTFLLDVEYFFPIGIIVNELSTNAMKYAFPNEAHGSITVSLRCIDDTNAEILVQDNGCGLSHGINAEQGGGFGMEMVRMMTEQISGRLSCRSAKDRGTEWSLCFSAHP